MLSSSNTMPSRELPPEREVDCACPSSMQRPVLRDHTGVNRRVTACLRCGAVSVTDSIVEEPRPHDVRCVANVVVDVAPAALAWLAAFPRVAGPAWEWQDPIYLPADTRAEDEAELEAIVGYRPRRVKRDGQDSGVPPWRVVVTTTGQRSGGQASFGPARNGSGDGVGGGNRRKSWRR